jgi:hypothetical protein
MPRAALFAESLRSLRGGSAAEEQEMNRASIWAIRGGMTAVQAEFDRPALFPALNADLFIFDF